MLFKLSTAVLASLALVRAQTVEADRFNLAEADLVGASGEVWDDAAYAPTVGTQVTFTDAGFEIPVLPGVLLTRNQTAVEPVIRLQSSANIAGKGYLVAMLDPDAPNPQNKSEANVRHWLAQNLVAGAGQNGLYQLAPNPDAVGKYAGPGPAAGSDPHRYTFLVFEQPTAQITAPSGNDVAPFLKFDIEAYAKSIEGLKLVGGTYMLVGPYGTVPNNGTYKPPTTVGGNDNGSSGSVSGTGTRTAGGSGATAAPGDGAAGLKVGFAAAAMGVAALFF
jgi:phosphatidylethanolamine-binding protein (PEBP) family uncharacterized protein